MLPVFYTFNKEFAHKTSFDGIITTISISKGEYMELYRYVSFETFVDLVQSSSLCFVFPPVSWEDTHEGFLYRAIKTPEGKQKILSLIPTQQNRLFAEAVLTDETLNHTRFQCWTQAQDQVALWSIYNYMNKAIMISSTSEKLEQLSFEEQKVTLMQLTYVNSISLEDEVKFVIGQKIFAPDIFRTKRSAFEHEKEVRAFVGTTRLINPMNPLRVPVPNIQDFIEGVMVHPNAPSWYVAVVEEYCRINHIRFLGQSKLYKFEI